VPPREAGDRTCQTTNWCQGGLNDYNSYILFVVLKYLTCMTPIVDKSESGSMERWSLREVPDALRTLGPYPTTVLAPNQVFG
jgi:hypothetical protein